MRRDRGTCTDAAGAESDDGAQDGYDCHCARNATTRSRIWLDL